MRCSSCNFENEPGAQFCEECGSKLVLACPGCGREVRLTAKFCSKCGTSLTAVAVAVPQGASPLSPAAPALPLPERRAAEAERRQLTVMFCDLVGSTMLSAQLDPEELREVMQQYQEVCTTVIQRYAGYIAQHLGDGLLVYFGYPSAHEDDAQRAVRAGLEIIDALRESPLRHRQLPQPLQVRIGIHTGLVVIGEIGSSEKREMLALGETPNFAARVQGVAEPDTVVISAVTQRLVYGLFECQNLGPQALKGISAPVSIYQVLGENAAQSRFEVAVGAGLMSHNGQGVPQDYVEALKWFRLAAAQEDADAQFNLGAMSHNGQGIPQDYTEALKWYRLAAAQGSAEAQVNLGLMYYKGQGIPQDYAEALKWFRLAAAQGDAEAQFNLGVMYHNGQGVPQDYVQALKCFNLAAATSTKPDLHNLAVQSRDKVAARMTPAQIAEAQKRARNWKKQ